MSTIPPPKWKPKLLRTYSCRHFLPSSTGQDKLLEVELWGQRWQRSLRSATKLLSRSLYQPAALLAPYLLFCPHCEYYKHLSSYIKGWSPSCAFTSLEPIRGILLRISFFPERSVPSFILWFLAAMIIFSANLGWRGKQMRYTDKASILAIFSLFKYKCPCIQP